MCDFDFCSDNLILMVDNIPTWRCVPQSDEKFETVLNVSNKQCRCQNPGRLLIFLLDLPIWIVLVFVMLICFICIHDFVLYVCNIIYHVLYHLDSAHIMHFYRFLKIPIKVQIYFFFVSRHITLTNFVCMTFHLS